MALTKLSPLSRGYEVGARQSEKPNEVTVTFPGDDTDNHDFIVDARGKGRLTVACHNKTNKTATISLYGAHDVEAEIGDDSVFLIGASFEVATTVAGYETCNDPFPFYIVRATFGDVPDGEDVILNVNLSAF